MSMRLVLAFALAAILAPLAFAALTCTFEAASTCSTGTKYLGAENDTGGYENAHAQNYSIGGYGNSLCCTTNLTDTLGRDCSDETLVALSAETNAHLQNNSLDTYSVDVCVSLDSSGITCAYVNGSCVAPATCQFSISNQSNAHIGSCDHYEINVCCTTTNGAPTVPVLLLPANGNVTVEERHPFFSWEASTDPQGQAIHYELNITAPGGCAAIPVRNVSALNQTSIEELCVDQSYNWTLRACDTLDACSAWAGTWNFTIASVVSISFTDNSTDFGSLDPSTAGDTVANDTLDSDPGPLVLQNDGNVDVDVDVRALGALWTNAGLDTRYFQFAEENSSSWINASASYANLTSGIVWNTTEELEVRVEVPIAEPPGAKSSTLQVLAESAE